MTNKILMFCKRNSKSLVNKTKTNSTNLSYIIGVSAATFSVIFIFANPFDASNYSKSGPYLNYKLIAARKYTKTMSKAVFDYRIINIADNEDIEPPLPEDASTNISKKLTDPYYFIAKPNLPSKATIMIIKGEYKLGSIQDSAAYRVATYERKQQIKNNQGQPDIKKWISITRIGDPLHNSLEDGYDFTTPNYCRGNWTSDAQIALFIAAFEMGQNPLNFTAKPLELKPVS